jgi:hypothetical protein
MDAFDIAPDVLRLVARVCLFLGLALVGAAASYFVEATDREQAADAARVLRRARRLK